MIADGPAPQTRKAVTAVYGGGVDGGTP
jgi:hypothetical protein